MTVVRAKPSRLQPFHGPPSASLCLYPSVLSCTVLIKLRLERRQVRLLTRVSHLAPSDVCHRWRQHSIILTEACCRTTMLTIGSWRAELQTGTHVPSVTQAQDASGRQALADRLPSS